MKVLLNQDRTFCRFVTSVEESSFDPSLLMEYVSMQEPEYDKTTCVAESFIVVHQEYASQAWRIRQKSPSELEISVPEEIPLWAFRTAIRKSGLKPAIDALLNALPEEVKADAMEHYEYGNYIMRRHPLVLALGSQLGLTEKQIDEIFLMAKTLT